MQIYDFFPFFPNFFVEINQSASRFTNHNITPQKKYDYSTSIYSLKPISYNIHILHYFSTSSKKAVTVFLLYFLQHIAIYR